jgi:hypothetical protein
VRLPLVLLAPLLVLAGCVSDAPVAEEGDAGADAAPGEGAAAPVDDGKTEMPAEVGLMPHEHDYWDGKERITLFEGTVEAGESDDPFAPFYGLPGGKVGQVPWLLPDGTIVYEGAGQMELTATWTDPLVTSLQARYRSGASPEFGEPVPLPNGETVVLELTPEMTDLPHRSVSRWAFLFDPAEPGALMGPFELRVEIVKVADISLFPGHPLLFAGLPEKVLHDQDHEHDEVSYPKRAPNVVTQGDFGEKTFAPASIVPMETKAMRIEVDILEASASPGVVSDIRFFYHGADTTYLGHPYVLPFEGSLEEGRLVYQIPVEPEQTDPPYADESQWLFFVEPTTKMTGADEEPDCGGCTDVSLRYHVRIIAYDHALETYSRMEGDD